MAKKGGKKKIEKLVPVKKAVTKPEQGTFQQTFYIDPKKKKPKEKDPAKPDETSSGRTKHPDETSSGRTKHPNDAEGNRTARSREESSEIGRKSDKDRMIPEDTNPHKDIKDFEDFGKKGIDPDSAKQFFCNM